MEEMYNAKTAAMNFVHEVCKVRAKGHLADFMNICIGVMNEYKVAHLSSNLPWPAVATHLGMRRRPLPLQGSFCCLDS